MRQVATAKLPGGVSPTEAFGEKTSPLDLHETERRLIAQALAATNGNITAAAKKLGISRRTLHRKINEMNLAKKSSRSRGRNVEVPLPTLPVTDSHTQQRPRQPFALALAKIRVYESRFERFN